MITTIILVSGTFALGVAVGAFLKTIIVNDAKQLAIEAKARLVSIESKIDTYISKVQVPLPSALAKDATAKVTAVETKVSTETSKL